MKYNDRSPFAVVVGTRRRAHPTKADGVTRNRRVGKGSSCPPEHAINLRPAVPGSSRVCIGMPEGITGIKGGRKVDGAQAVRKEEDI
jgi:hypothetical protein